MHAISPLTRTEATWHLSVAFDPGAHHPYFRHAVWGACYSSQASLPDGVDALGRVVPEGLLMRHRCSTCGARTEILTDLRSLNELYYGHPSVPLDFAEFGVERAHGIERLLLTQKAQAWAEEHRACEAVARPLPEGVEPVVAGLWRDAAQSLREAGETPDVYAAVLDTGGVLHFDADGPTEGGRALSAFRVREAVRQCRGSELAAAVAAGEVATEEGAEWQVVVVTGSCGWIGRAAVDRFDRPAPGPGRLGELDWQPLTADHDAADGLAARRQPFPLPRSFAARRAHQLPQLP